MNKYIIEYFFDGTGTVTIEADSEEEARDKFFDGDFANEQERGENYYIGDVILQ